MENIRGMMLRYAEMHPWVLEKEPELPAEKPEMQTAGKRQSEAGLCAHAYRWMHRHKRPMYKAAARFGVPYRRFVEYVKKRRSA